MDPTTQRQDLPGTLAELEQAVQQARKELAVVHQVLQREQQRYQEFFESAPEAYVVTDAAGQIEEANRAAAGLLHVGNPQRLLGRPLTDFLTKEHQPVFREMLTRLASGTSWRQEGHLRLNPERGAAVDARLNGVVVPNPQDQTSRIRWWLEDVTAQTNAQELANIGQMTAGLAHEGRNYLQRSLANLTRLEWRLQNQPVLLEFVAGAKKAQDDLRVLFDNVQQYLATLRLEYGLYNLVDLWRKVSADVMPPQSGRGIALQEELGPVNLQCEVDRTRIALAFRNVFDQALASGGNAAQIALRAIETSLPDGRPAVQVMVHPKGSGSAEEHQQRAFELFHASKTKETGLGLTVARRIVEAHGGTLDIRAGPGSRAEICITLPRRRA